MATWNGLTGCDFTQEEKDEIDGLVESLKEFTDTHDLIYNESEKKPLKKKNKHIKFIILSILIMISSTSAAIFIALTPNHIKPGIGTLIISIMYLSMGLSAALLSKYIK